MGQCRSGGVALDHCSGRQHGDHSLPTRCRLRFSGGDDCSKSLGAGYEAVKAIEFYRRHCGKAARCCLRIERLIDSKQLGEILMPPTIGNGKICYLEMPATDIARSAAFYQAVFGWNVR